VFFSRRQVLKAAAGTAALSLLGSMPFAPPAQAGTFSGRRLVTATGQVAAIIDLEALRITHIPLGFIPHSFVQSPKNPDRVWAIKMESWAATLPISKEEMGQPWAAEMDLREQKVLQNLYLPETSGLSGHGFFTADAAVLFIPRIDMEKGSIYLTGYEANDCRKIVADYPVAPGTVHDSRLLPDGTAMVASSGFMKKYDSKLRVKKDELIQFDIHAGRSTRTWALDDDKQLLSHFAALKDGSFLVVSEGDIGNVPGMAYIGGRGSASLEEIPFSGHVKPGVPGELLSLAVNEARHRAVVTNPQNFRLLVIDIEHRAFVKEITHHSFGMVFDEKAERFIGSGEGLYLLDAKGNADGNKEASRFKMPHSFDSAHSLLI
jgi:hypothetical protein